MKRHSECLHNICRLCGCENPPSWKGRTPLKKEAMKKLLNDALDIDIEADVEGLHAYFVCKCCFMKLNRWKTKTKKMLTCERRKVKTNITIRSFDDGICHSCGEHVVSPPVVKTLAEYEKEAKEAGLLTWYSGEQVQIVRLTNAGLVIMHLTVLENFDWKLSVGGTELKNKLENFNVQNTREVKELFCRNVCVGNNDFQDIIDRKTGPNGEIPVKVTVHDNYSPMFKTIRHNNCHFFVSKEGERCSMCKVMRSNLAQIRNNQEKAPSTVTASSTIPNIYLTHSQLQNKSSEQQLERISLKRKIHNLQNVISELYDKESEVLSKQQSSKLEEAFNANAKEFTNLLPEGSAGRLLYEQQVESLKKNKQMRWHPAIIRWCIALHTRSASNYEFLRSSGFLRLPHPSSLQKYTHFADPDTGISAEILSRIATDIGVDKDGATLKQDVTLLFDEMKIKAGLYYSVRSGKIVGFTDVGDLANEVARFELRCKGENEPVVASHVLVIMLRGIFSDLHSPVGYFATTTATSDQLFAILWEAVEFVEVAGFKVRALVSDGASPNRKFYRLHSALGTTSLIYSTLHHVDPSRTIYFICDVPHLLKTTRNNFENSGYHNKTRHLHYNKQDIKWSQLLDLYEWDIGLDRTSPGLRRLHKISYEHLHLTPSLRMRVYMAAQVLSSSVANALEMYGDGTTKSTVKFIRMFDKFFDCLNVSNCSKGIHCRKDVLKEYRSSDDWRFVWLKDEFLGFLDEWEAEVDSMDNVTSSTKKKMLLSKETLEGLRITVHSFVELGKNLLDCPDVEYLLSDKFNQDPLENYFSKQRGAGGRCENPTVAQFGHNMLALYVASDCAKASKRGNSRVLEKQIHLDDTPLPKRKPVC